MPAPRLPGYVEDLLIKLFKQAGHFSDHTSPGRGTAVTGGDNL